MKLIAYEQTNLQKKKELLCFTNASKWNQYYGSLNVNHITDHENFLRVVKPNFSNKRLGTNRVILRNGGKIISDTEMVGDTFNRFLVNIEKLSKLTRINNFQLKHHVFDPV